MVSGSQLQVAKLAQMCPAVAAGGQRHSAVPYDADQCQPPEGAHYSIKISLEFA